jgi:3',5'-nucleoside bisphosphate phosphatase
MIPPLIVARAIEVGLDIIAVTDHNSAENVEAVIEAARGTALKVLPGMECETVEGVHMVCIFDEVPSALALQEKVYRKLPDLPNRPETFGAQFVVDEEGEFVRYNDRLLLVPSELSIEEIWGIVQDLGGLAFPAHVDRPGYGIYGVLGFMPDHPVFPAVEISSRITAAEARAKYPDLNGKRIFCSSDAHRLDEMGSVRTMLELGHRTVAEIRMMSDK